MTEIVWGDPIPVNGVRPEWLRDEEMVRGHEEDGAWFFNGYRARSIDWDDMSNIMLSADHPYYLATSKGFTYWPGGDSAPDDWDGGEVLVQDGHGAVSPCYKAERILRGGELTQANWSHSGMAVHIIGYHKRTEPTAPAIAPKLVERMLVFCKSVADVRRDSVIGKSMYGLEARAILAELEPSPVERFKRENLNLSPDELLAKALEGRAA